MSILSQIGKRFRSKLKIVGGPAFLGQMGSIPDTSRVSNFLSARRYLRTAVVTPVKPGKVILANDREYIVADHGDGFYVEPYASYFKLFEVDVVADWYPKAFAVDPITGVETLDRSVKSTTKVRMSTQPKTDIEDQLQIQTGQKTAIVNVAVAVDDILDQYIVTKVDQVLGVYLVELKDKQ